MLLVVNICSIYDIFGGFPKIGVPPEIIHFGGVSPISTNRFKWYPHGYGNHHFAHSWVILMVNFGTVRYNL